jgi:ribosomal protein S18
LNKNIFYLIFLFIFFIIIFLSFNTKDGDVNKHHQSLKNTPKIILKEKDLLKSPDTIENKNIAVVKEEKVILKRKIIKNNLLTKDITINNFNKFFNYQNIDLLLNSYITTDDMEMQKYILLRFHQEIKNNDVINKIIDMYLSSTDKTEQSRLSILLSEIDTDDKLNVFFENIDFTNNNMIADFIASTYKINTQNSTNKLLSLIDKVYDNNLHLKGIELLYSNIDTSKVLNNIDLIIQNNNYNLSNKQEKFIFYILEKAPSNQSLIFIDKYKYNFIDQNNLLKLEKKIKDKNKR